MCEESSGKLLVSVSFEQLKMFWPWWLLIVLVIAGLVAAVLYCLCDRGRTTHVRGVAKGWTKNIYQKTTAFVKRKQPKTTQTTTLPPSSIVVEGTPTSVPTNNQQVTVPKLENVPSSLAFDQNGPSGPASGLLLNGEQVLQILKSNQDVTSSTITSNITHTNPQTTNFKKSNPATEPIPMKPIQPDVGERQSGKPDSTTSNITHTNPQTANFKMVSPAIKRVPMKPIQPDIGVSRYKDTIYVRVKNSNYNLSYRSRNKHMSNMTLNTSIARAMTRKRAIHIPVNTVFEKPMAWHLWQTNKSDRIVSSNVVPVMQCFRKPDNTIDVEEYGYRYVVFEKLNMGHHFRGTRLQV